MDRPWTAILLVFLIAASLGPALTVPPTADHGQHPLDVREGAPRVADPAETAATAYIVSTSPADGAVNVSVDANIVVVFSETVSPTNITWTIAPAITITGMWNPSYTTLTMTHVVPFAECTVYTISIGGVLPGPVPNPWTFTTTCPSPVILATNPADGATAIPANAPIVVTFSKSMSTTTVTATISGGMVLNFSWNSPTNTILTLTHSTPFAPCTTYSVGISGFDTSGNPLVAGPVPNPFSFSTIACLVELLSPLGGEDWTGGSVHAIRWNQTHPSGADLNWTLEWWPGESAPTWPDIPVSPYPYPGGNYSNYLYNAPEKQRTDVPAATSSATWTAQFFSGNDVDYGIFQDLECDGVYTVADLISGYTMATSANPETFTASSPPAGCYWVHIAGFDAYSTTTTTITLTLDGWSFIASGSSPPGVQTYDWTVPLVNTSITKVRVCVTPYAPPPECDTGGAFTIDSTPPAIVSHDPPDGAFDVPVTMFLTVTFSESMDRMKTERAFTSSPPAFVLSSAWPDPTTLVLQLEGLRSATRYVWGFDCTATDDSSPGNPLANCTATHDFTTEGGTPASSISLLSPRGGESWTGGSTHDVRFTVTNTGPMTDIFTVNATFRYEGGTQTGSVGVANLTVPAGVALDGQFSWVVPAADALDAIVNVTATNRTGATYWDEGLAFEIDSTAPRVTTFSPSGPRVPLDAIIMVGFSEPMALPVPPSSALTIAPAVTLTVQWSPARDALTATTPGLRACTAYTVTLAALHDDSDPGNPLPSPSPMPWTFSTICAPAVSLLAPDGAEDWTGGSTHTIQWVTSDPDDSTLTIDLAYSLDGGADGFSTVIAGPLVVAVGGGSYAWTLPRTDSSAVLVRITVTDSAGNAAFDTSAAVFIIDSTPPALLVSFPADGASGHKTTRDLWFVWTERVDRASFTTAFGLSPDPGGLGLDWSVSNLGGDVLLVTHDPMKSRTAYSATFAATAKDDSDPGNFLAAAVVVGFTTQPPPPVNPPVALAVGHNQVEVGTPTTFDGTGSTGELRDYVWRIADNHGGFVAVLVGSVATYTFQQQGRYSVTLFVTDVNGVVDDDTIEIAVTSNPHSDGLIAAGAAGAALVAAALIAGTEGGKLAAFQFFLFPLYARRKRDELLDHENRGMIRGYILVHPGDSYSDIRRNLGLSNGTLSYHLTVLEREGIVRSQTRGARKLFYPREARLPNDGGGMHEVQIRMLRAIEQIPGLAVTDLAGALGITSQLALYHLRDLAAKGRIRFERRGFRLRCYAQGAEAHDPPPETLAPKD